MKTSCYLMIFSHADLHQIPVLYLRRCFSISSNWPYSCSVSSCPSIVPEGLMAILVDEILLVPSTYRAQSGASLHVLELLGPVLSKFSHFCGIFVPSHRHFHGASCIPKLSNVSGDEVDPLFSPDRVLFHLSCCSKIGSIRSLPGHSQNSDCLLLGA